ERVLHPSTTNLRWNSHNPTRRDVAEEMGLRKRNQPLHRSRSLPPNSVEQPRTHLACLGRKIPGTNTRLLPVHRGNRFYLSEHHIIARFPLSRSQLAGLHRI